MWNKERKYTNELIDKAETDSQISRTNLWLPGGKAWGKGIVRQFSTNMKTLLHLKWITNKVLLYSTWNSAQCYVAVWMGGDLGGRMDTCQRRQWHPTPVLLPGKSHGWRSLVGCSPWGRKESDTTE